MRTTERSQLGPAADPARSFIVSCVYQNSEDLGECSVWFYVGLVSTTYLEVGRSC